MPVIVAPPAAAPAILAQPRSAEQQARLAALAQALGRAHALHRLCNGPADDRWRRPMQRLLAVEHATPALRDRLTLSFNAGFAAQGVHRRCDSAARAALGEAAAQGRDLARGLAAEPGDTP